ncbi:MAG: sigma-70 family RNA polymerase sigma factor [Microthrixaceae bacterium]
MDELTRLALAAGDGDRQALASFVRASQVEVWRLCAHLVDRGAADDLTQEVYLRAVPALSRFRGDSSARTWLLTIARRTCADALRRTIRQRRLLDRVKHATTHDDVFEPDVSAQVSGLDDLVDQLSEERRSAFVMTQLLGLSYGETAEICGVPVGTIRSRVSRARADLLRLLEDDRSERAAEE